MTARCAVLPWLATAFAAAASSSVGAGPPTALDLSGAWTLRAEGEPETTPATVPGTVHTDLLAAGKIPDPFFGDHWRRLKWVADTPWTYAKTFTPPAGVLARPKIALELDGLDTIASVTLNGTPLGRADNMFRRWTFDVKPVLRPGENTLVVTFTPFENYVRDFVAAAKGTGPNTAYGGMSDVRKALYGNGWDFAPKLAAVGICGPARLVGYDAVRMTGVLVDSRVKAGGPGTITVRPALSDAPPAGTRMRVTVTLDGTLVATRTADAGRPVAVAIEKPRLWWPNGMGDRPLYGVRVELLDSGGRVTDTLDRRTGLRDVELVRPADGRPLHLKVNGRTVFARGANWVPPDMFLPRVTLAHQRHLLESAADAHMNMIRTWGGGAYEDDAFYDACDELGLMVWHDFKFACNAYPGRNAAFADNVRREVAEQVTRLSPHPSLAVWCGNNEVEAIVNRFGLMSRDDYKLLFAGVIGGGVRALLPDAEFVTGSPDAGDEHNWWVWHIGADFEKYRESHGWMTEFGFQSFPVPATVDGFTVPADRASVLTPVMKAHQHNGNGRGNEMILDQTARYFRPAKDFESTLWLSQITQAYGLTMGIEHWRADWPRSSGAFVWQLNDSAPAASWSMIDYHGRWKAAQYVVRRAFAPVIVTGVYDAKTDTLPLTICSDRARPFRADVRWQATDAAGTVVAAGEAALDVPAGPVAVPGPTLDLKDAVRRVGRDDLVVWADVADGSGVVASDAFFAARFKALKPIDPGLTSRVERNGDGFDVTLTAARPAWFAWLDLAGDPDARFSDNFAHVAAGRPLRVRVTPSRPTDLAAFERQLVARSLYDTFRP